jgi:hypothetical protein
MVLSDKGRALGQDRFESGYAARVRHDTLAPTTEHDARSPLDGFAGRATAWLDADDSSMGWRAGGIGCGDPDKAHDVGRARGL